VESLSGKIVRTVIRGRRVSFFIHNEKDLIQAHHNSGEFYETEELDIIAQWFEGGCFIDIGTNVGNHTLFASLFLSPERIICIEPNPEAIRILRANIQLNSLRNVDLSYLGIGLSDRDGVGLLNCPQEDNAGATQIIVGNGPIRVAAGDELFRSAAPSFLKIDVEGMELRVLEGLKNTIETFSPRIFIEIDSYNMGYFDLWCRKNSYAVMDRFKRYNHNENFLLVRS